jgi:MoxR-like ATPase
LKFDNEFLKDRNATIEAELERLNTSKNPIDKGKRIEAIEQPVITLVRNGSEPSGTVEKSVNDMTEIEWLQNISKGCTDHGLVFPQRILWAYHTALKTAEMSPITVLAGVSGTGKSELPKLYAYFGGLNFMPVSVQPNWDSQESMLGYFNSIDNRFDAQPLLRFLAQGAKKTEKDSEFITGLRKYVNLVLLDEMNLAHVEYYFAEFLSKLEDRRSKGRNEEPQLEVKLGSGIEPHMLNMVRNVLWTGTMNQDETTKSLSDKVLDRGIVINFPRPIELKSRVELKTLAPNNDAASKLLYVTWMGTEERKGFVKRKNYFETESNDKGKKLMDDAKKLVEEINRCLSIAGRAVGHRVWQSVEYYILNYPSVVAAHESGTKLDSAFTVALEDQIVQKIMPKLRGIEIRGRQKTECLDRTRVILEDHSLNLTEDFNFACEAGYGQFMWNSAYYIDKSGIGSTTSAGEPRNEEGNDDSGNELTDDGQ